MNAFINPPQPSNPGIEISEGFGVVLIKQQTSSGVIQIASKGNNPTFATIHLVQPERSFILVVEEGYESRISGVSAVRYFSLSMNASEAEEADKAIEANKDMYKNL